MLEDCPESSKYLQLNVILQTIKCTTGLSIIEGIQESLARLQLDYVDILFAHRSDPNGKRALRTIVCLVVSPADFVYLKSRWKKVLVPTN